VKRGKPLKRTEFKRKPPSTTGRSKQSLPQYSKKRSSERSARQEVVLLALERAHHKCEARHVTVAECRGPLDVDEIIARSAWAKGYLELGNVQVLCRMHHDWKHDNPLTAKDLGWTRESWERPMPGQEVDLRVW